MYLFIYLILILAHLLSIIYISFYISFHLLSRAFLIKGEIYIHAKWHVGRQSTNKIREQVSKQAQVSQTGDEKGYTSKHLRKPGGKAKRHSLAEKKIRGHLNKQGQKGLARRYASKHIRDRQEDKHAGKNMGDRQEEYI